MHFGRFAERHSPTAAREDAAALSETATGAAAKKGSDSFLGDLPLLLGSTKCRHISGEGAGVNFRAFACRER